MKKEVEIQKMKKILKTADIYLLFTKKKKIDGMIRRLRIKY